MFKLGFYSKNESQEYHYSGIYNVEQNSNYERIVLGLTKSHVDIILDLMDACNEPFYILYVLHTPHSCEEGRYQSGALTYDEVSTLLNCYKDFFENDARHDIWIHSPETNTTIVYDRHNLVYLYGFTGQHLHIIEQKGLKKESIHIPCPHVHCYNAEYDNLESRLLNEYQWKRTPLHEEDKQ